MTRHAWLIFCSIFIGNTVKLGRSLTHVVSPDEIQHIRSKSEWGVCRRLLRGRKHFLQSVMVSVAVSKPAETDLAFVQPDAKINCVNYCKNVIEQGLLSAIRRLEQRLCGPAGHCACTPFTPHCRLGLPAFQCAWVHWTRKLAAEQFESKYRGLFSVVKVAANGVSLQNFRHWSAAASSDRLIGSGKPGHTEPSDWSTDIKTDDGCQGKGWSCRISSGLTIGIRYRSCTTVFRMKIEQTRASLSNLMQCWGIDDLCKLGEEYLTVLTCNLCILF